MKADLHIHTNFSYDGLSSPQEMVASAISKGIDCICITDHHEIRGAIEALRFAFSKSILVIPGIEIRTKEGDILGLNVKKIIPGGLSAKETIIEINKLGGMAIIAHPFAWPRNFQGDLKGLFEQRSNFFIGIEVLNASVPNFANKKALKFAQDFGASFIAASDAHETDFIGKAILEIPGDGLSAEEVLEEIKKRNVKLKKEKVGLFEKITRQTKRSLQKFKRGKLRI